MYSSYDQVQNRENCGSAPQSDPLKDRQLELELQAFAELLLDIHEYRRRQKRRDIGQQPQFDEGSMERKME
jgi:hypothetical protein